MTAAGLQRYLGLPESETAVFMRGIDADRDGIVTRQEVDDYLNLHTEHADGWEPEATVYLARDADGDLLYVGITGRNIRRLHSHAKAAQWWPLAASITLEHQPTRGRAEARERQLIRELHPRFNVVYALETA